MAEEQMIDKYKNDIVRWNNTVLIDSTTKLWKWNFKCKRNLNMK